MINSVSKKLLVAVMVSVIILSPFGYSKIAEAQSDPLSSVIMGGLDSNLAASIGGTVVACVASAWLATNVATALATTETATTTATASTIGITAVPVSDRATHTYITKLINDSVLQRTKEVSTAVGAGPSLDSIAFCVINAVIQAIITATTVWVQSGFEGKPLFVDDPEQFFGQIADEYIGAFLDEISDGVLCSPWEIDIKLALLRKLYPQKPKGCTLSDVVGNMESFVNGNFHEGGWTGWFTLTQYEENNPYNVLPTLQEMAEHRAATGVNLARTELGWGSGFLSFKVNEEVQGPTQPGEARPTATKTVTPGQMVQHTVNKRMGLAEDRIVLATEFDQLVTALINFLVQETFDQIIASGRD